jgi:hypothetical protein
VLKVRTTRLAHLLNGRQKQQTCVPIRENESWRKSAFGSAHESILAIILTFPRSFGEIVTLIVGKSATKLMAHKKMLCAASPFFEAACKHEWQNADACVIALPEADPEVVKMLLSWVYEDDICVATHHFFCDIEHLDNASGLLLKLYILGDKFQMPALQNDVIDALNDEVLKREGYGWQFMNYAFKETSETDPLRLFLVYFAICEWSADKLQSYKSHLCPEFTHSMAVEFLKCRSNEETIDSLKDLSGGTFCTLFHRHSSSLQTKPECRSFSLRGFRLAGLRHLQ